MQLRRPNRRVPYRRRRAQPRRPGTVPRSPQRRGCGHGAVLGGTPLPPAPPGKAQLPLILPKGERMGISPPF